MNKIQRLFDITLGTDVVERLCSDLAVRVSPEELVLILTIGTGKSLDELADLDLSLDQVKLIYQESDGYKADPKVLAIVDFEESIIPEGTERALFEQYVTHNGERWVIHKSDADPHPSTPHAHNYDSNLKLHLGSGELYMGRRRVGKIRAKHLVEIRERISGIDLPPLAA
jgi:hypothetical protein